MRKAQKTKKRLVKAYRLGEGSETELALLASGRIRIRDDGKYELFSQEAVNGTGEIASRGDWFKVDGAGFPYPNSRKYFLENHRHVEGDVYEQIPTPLYAWTLEDGMCDEIQYLIDEHGLLIDGSDPRRCFTARLWGSVESAASDAVIVFYEIEYDESGKISDAVFNFVERGEFDRTYEWID